MSMTISAVPDLRDRQLESLKEQLREAREQLEQVEQELAAERSKRKSVERGVQEMRKVLAPLYGALQLLHGEMDAMGIGASPQAETGNGSFEQTKVAVWESWKKKLGGKAADAIDALRLHGEMTHTQLKIHIRCGQQTVYDTVHRLNKAGIINKNSGRISLKEL